MAEQRFSITGKIIQILPETGGVSKQGKEWKKCEFIMEYGDQYPKKVCITTMGEAATSLQYYKVNDEVTAHFSPESREYLGKWYSEYKAWKLDGSKANMNAANPPAPQAAQEEGQITSEADKDLGF